MASQIIKRKRLRGIKNLDTGTTSWTDCSAISFTKISDAPPILQFVINGQIGQTIPLSELQRPNGNPFNNDEDLANFISCEEADD